MACGLVSQREQVEALVARATSEWGGLDVLCNVAGILLLERFDKITAEQFRKVLEVNLVGTFMMCQAALPQQNAGQARRRRRGEGRARAL